MKKLVVLIALTAAFFLLQSNSYAAGMRIESGSSVHLNYMLQANGVALFPAGKMGEMNFILGQGRYPSEFEKQLIGLKKGDSKNIKLSPDQAFGPVRTELIKRISKSELPPSIPLQEGVILGGKKGQRPIRIAKILEDSVVLDENHPLAGKTLDYHVEVTDVQ